MSDVLVLVQIRRGVVQEASLSAVGAGVELKRSLGCRLVLGVVGPSDDRFATELAFDGVDEVVAVPTTASGFDPELEETAAVAIIEQTDVSVVLYGHGVDAMAIAPAVAVSIDAGLATDVVSVEASRGQVHVERAPFGGQLVERLAFIKERVVITIRANSYAAPVLRGGRVPMRQFDAPVASSRTKHLRWIDPEGSGVDITKHDLLLSVGRPIGGTEDVQRVEKVALALGGVMSASRPVVDAGWAEPGRQVGQTGRTVKPKVYLAMGISGAIQHLAGMSGAETVIAVNTDTGAPINQHATYTASVDMHELIDALEDLVGL